MNSEEHREKINMSQSPSQSSQQASDVLREFAEQVKAADQSHQPLRLRGGGSKDFYGQTVQGKLLDTTVYHGIVSYEPTELVITARCGTPLTVVQECLHQQGQMLAFEPPHFGGTATLGGCIAAGLAGPSRQAAGGVRDFVLGAVIMDHTGHILNFGGQVMKNVAGYDVSRVLCGSLGTLGLITEISLKVLPLPAQEITLQLSMAEEAALQDMNQWAGQPLPITATAYYANMLHVRLAGAAPALKAAINKIGGDVMEANHAAVFWQSLREQTHSFFNEAQQLWRLSLPSTTPAQDFSAIGASTALIEWGGAQRWLSVSGPTAQAAILLRAAATRLGGHATLFRGGDKSVGVFQPLAPAIATIHRNLKKEFDPHGVFNRGRMYADF